MNQKIFGAYAYFNKFIFMNFYDIIKNIIK